ncbi:hypothetical protein QUB80_30365 [Chlorogloeopsis sp. ULAP01]|uniref:hypothetical protein n=1 Tax=Chlorogloeopsis sp. ULAP01 TaxID=3056483 RepID=UPI0025AB3DDE|nr:hypothetical protein [Chlorogloeopsis sp. ULAP01]MDM9384966.1 hypothetical protein [Chlorogloeopsis sp. ULAP01]
MTYLPTALQAQVHPSKQNDIATDTLTGCTVISVPIILVLIIISYRKCKAQILRQQIAHMEKIWRLNDQDKNP